MISPVKETSHYKWFPNTNIQFAVGITENRQSRKANKGSKHSLCVHRILIHLHRNTCLQIAVTPELVITLKHFNTPFCLPVPSPLISSFLWLSSINESTHKIKIISINITICCFETAPCSLALCRLPHGSSLLLSCGCTLHLCFNNKASLEILNCKVFTVYHIIISLQLWQLTIFYTGTAMLLLSTILYMGIIIKRWSIFTVQIKLGILKIKDVRQRPTNGFKH